MARLTPRAWWGRLALRWKTLLVAGIPLLVLVLSVPVAFTAQRDSAKVGRAVEHAYRVRASLASVLQAVVDAETSIRGYLLTGEAEFLGPYRTGLVALPRGLSSLDRLLNDAGPHASQLLDELHELIDERVQILERTLAFAKDTPTGAIPETLLAIARRVTDDIRSTVAQLDEDEAGRLADLRNGLRSAERVTFVLSVIVVPAALLGTVVAVLAFTAGLARGVKRIEENAGRMERGEPLLDPPHGDDELAHLGHVLRHTAARLAKQDAELRELALVDPLTGLRNRRAFLEIAEHEIRVAARRGSVTALLFFDVDGLKAVNDRLGHAVGDEMLREFALVLRSYFRSADLVARLGGDEFCALLSRDSAMDGTDVIERLERAVAQRNDQPDRRFRLAFSVGVEFFDPAEATAVEDLIARADAAMYEEKRRKQALNAGT